MIEDVLIGKWQQVRGRSREWWSRWLTDGDLGRSRQFDRFIGRPQEQHGWNRVRAAKELLRRMGKQRARQQLVAKKRVTAGSRPEGTECKTYWFGSSSAD